MDWTEYEASVHGCPSFGALSLRFRSQKPEESGNARSNQPPTKCATAIAAIARGGKK
jgi:hypothetical protein